MSREHDRHPGGEHAIRIVRINDEQQPDPAVQLIHVHNIGKGGFRFETDIDLQLEDRVSVILTFPDGYQQEVHGRICYCEDLDNGAMAYGFSILSGFYSMEHSSV